MIHYTANLEKLELIHDQYLLVTLVRPSEFQFVAGQHILFYLEDEQGPFERYFSIASAPSQKERLEFCVQTLVDSRASSYFEKLKKGSDIRISESRGTFKIHSTHSPIVLIAGGSGISPMRSFALDLLSLQDRKSPLLLLYGCRESRSIPFQEELIQLSKARGPQFQLVLLAESSSEESIIEGNVIEGLKRKATWIDSQVEFYACGPAGMIKAVTEYLVSAGILENQIFFEKYSSPQPQPLVSGSE